jgi:hypothetical protein
VGALSLELGLPYFRDFFNFGVVLDFAESLIFKGTHRFDSFVIVPQVLIKVIETGLHP